jgi:hypothetical protein
MNRLRILQYNVQKSKKVMEPLLAESRTQSYDIIVIQEPWRNPNQNCTYCPSASAFIPAYDDCKRRSCFLVHKGLDASTWSVEFPTPDLAVLNLNTSEYCMWIYSVYSEPPGSYTVTKYDTPITLLPDLLNRDGEHIILGDLNLHHPMWCGVRNPTAHLAAEPLAQLAASYRLLLATPKGAATWEARGSTSTIDLAFLSSGLQDRLITCTVQPDLDFGSDHYPVATELELASVRVEPVPRRCWKRMNRDIVEAGTKHLDPGPINLSAPRDIDVYANYIVGFT